MEDTLKRRYGTDECSVEGCNNKHKAMGYCNKHYLRFKNSGDPLSTKFVRISGSLEQRFWPRVDRTGTCWIWKGRKMKDGYGVIDINYKSYFAHRVAYELVIGKIPDGLELDHTCHKKGKCIGVAECPHRACVNPLHLEPVTHRINTLRGNSGLGSKGRVLAKKTHCRNGHEFTPENTAILPSGDRRCRICTRVRDNTRRAKIRADRITAGEVITRGPNPGTHCQRGHEFTPGNTYIAKSGQRVCRKCAAMKTARYRARQKQAK